MKPLLMILPKLPIRHDNTSPLRLVWDWTFIQYSFGPHQRRSKVGKTLQIGRIASNLARARAARARTSDPRASKL